MKICHLFHFIIQYICDNYPVESRGEISSTKIPTGPTGKSGPPQKVDQFFRNFSGWTEPIHWVLDWNFREFWLNGSRPRFLRRSVFWKFVDNLTSYPRRYRPPNPRVGPPILADIPGCIESLVARETRCNVRRKTKWRTSGKVCPRFDLGVNCFSFRDMFGHY